MKNRKIRTIIVDDDVLALTTLKLLIHVEQILIVGEFTRPEEALEYIKTHVVDLMITDMRMPRLDGIQLIRQIKDYNSQIELIAISSYKDFHYVKESLKEGSVDYILKHTLNEEILTQALVEAVKRIQSKNREKKMEENIYFEGQEALKEKIFQQLFVNQITPQKVEETLRRHKIPLDMSSMVLIMCEIDDYGIIETGFGEDDKRIFLETVRGIIVKVVEKVPESVIVTVQAGCFILLLSFTGVKSQLYIYSRTTEYCKRLNENIKKILDVQMSVSMGALCSSIEQLKNSYEQCSNLLENKFTQGKGNVYSGYGKEYRRSVGGKSLEAIAFRGEDIYQKLMQSDRTYAEDIKGIFGYYKKMKFPMSVVELNIVDMLNAGYRVVADKALEQLKEDYGFQELYKRIKKLETIDEIQEIILYFYSQIEQEIGRLSIMLEQKYSKHTVKALRFIETHYKANISQQDVAELLGVHSAYLSKTFKTDIGCGFSEYLNRVRIEKAKDMIESGKYRIKDIYNQTGFNQYNYFFKVFKQLAGCTPVEYEKKIKKI